MEGRKAGALWLIIHGTQDAVVPLANAETLHETVGELVAVALLRPDLAQRHFEEGWFIPWLNDQGRHDLAALAECGRTRKDGLQRFLAAAAGQPHDTAG